MAANPFSRVHDEELETLIAVISDPTIGAAAEALPEDPIARLEVIRTSMRREQFPTAVAVAEGSDLRIVPRWFEDHLHAGTDRFLPSGTHTGPSPNKTSVCVSIGTPIEGVGACVSAEK